jgi:Fe2+ transport system protein FeoA
MLQLSVNRRTGPAKLRRATLVDLRRGEQAVLDRLELPVDEARRLMELGFIPGSRIAAGMSAPGGDPRVFQVDGSEVALRYDTAAHIHVRLSRERNP